MDPSSEENISDEPASDEQAVDAAIIPEPTPAPASSSLRTLRPLYDVLFSPATSLISVFCLVMSLLLPPDGAGITICLMKRMMDLPCPGCGLTRSVTCMSQLDLGKAWDYHPFGPLIWMLFIANAVLLVAGDSARQRIAMGMQRYDRFLNPLYLCTVLAFLLYGFTRLGYEIWLRLR